MHKAEGSVWAVKEHLLLFEDCEMKKGKDIADLLRIYSSPKKWHQTSTL